MTDNTDIDEAARKAAEQEAEKGEIAAEKAADKAIDNTAKEKNVLISAEERKELAKETAKEAVAELRDMGVQVEPMQQAVVEKDPVPPDDKKDTVLDDKMNEKTDEAPKKRSFAAKYLGLPE